MKKQLVERFRVPRKQRIHLKDFDPSWCGDGKLKHLTKEQLKERARRFIDGHLKDLAEAQQLLAAANTKSVLIVLQAMDAAGKDGTIKHVMSGVNPQGCMVHSFKQPSAEELGHSFLWRYWKAVPQRGQICIFNRSHYEDVLIVRVHPELLGNGRLSKDHGPKFWAERYQDINRFERHLARNGTVILKFFLHLSRKEQKHRFLERLNDPHKHWKFSAADVEERRHWDAYHQAYEQAIAATNTRWAPWFIVPADHKWITRSIVAAIITQTICKLDLSYPQITPQQMDQMRIARESLLKEKD